MILHIMRRFGRKLLFYKTVKNNRPFYTIVQTCKDGDRSISFDQETAEKLLAILKELL